MHEMSDYSLPESGVPVYDCVHERPVEVHNIPFDSEPARFDCEPAAPLDCEPAPRARPIRKAVIVVGGILVTLALIGAIIIGVVLSVQGR